MNYILQLAFGIGGVGIFCTILIILIRYLSGIISDAILKKYQNIVDKQLENYKLNLQKEIEKYKNEIEKFTYISKIQFETEFKIYRAIFEKIFDFVTSSYNLYPTFDQLPADEKAKKEVYQKRYIQYVNDYNDFSRCLEQNAPFIPKSIYEKFDGLRRKSNEIGVMFPDIRIEDNPMFSDDNRQMAKENFKKAREFKESADTIRNEVREYLDTLKVIE